MRDRLFELGVFDDDDAPPPKAGPVQNVDEMPLKWEHHCPRCDCIMVEATPSGNCKDCHQKVMEQKQRRVRQKKKEAQLSVAAIVGNLCSHCGVRRRRYLSRTCGQRACERHE